LYAHQVPALDDLDETKRHRTTLNLPVELLAEAERELEMDSATETVTVALRELVASRRRARLLEMELPDLTLASLEELRRPRLAEPVRRDARAR
jgi:Arc/MetJ family transcription regulator